MLIHSSILTQEKKKRIILNLRSGFQCHMKISFSKTLMMFPSENLNIEPAIPDRSVGLGYEYL